MKDFIYCKECVFRDDYCKCTKLGLIHTIDKIQLPAGNVLRLNEPIAMCDAMHVNNDDGCRFGKRRTYDEELTRSMSTM